MIDIQLTNLFSKPVNIDYQPVISSVLGVFWGFPAPLQTEYFSDLGFYPVTLFEKQIFALFRPLPPLMHNRHNEKNSVWIISTSPTDPRPRQAQLTEKPTYFLHTKRGHRPSPMPSLCC